MIAPKMDFDEWWEREGKRLDPEASVSWYDKRRDLAEAAWAAAKAQSGNYVCDDAERPCVVTFANGREVRQLASDWPEAQLEIGWAST